MMKLCHIAENSLDEGLKEKLAAGLAGAGITAGALFGGNAMMNKGQAPEQPAVQVQQNEKPDESLQATRGIQRKVIERDDGTYYFYYQSNSSNSPRIKMANMKMFQTKATHQFMKDTGSDMKGVQHGVSTKDGVNGIWFKM